MIKDSSAGNSRADTIHQIYEMEFELKLQNEIKEEMKKYLYVFNATIEDYKKKANSNQFKL